MLMIMNVWMTLASNHALPIFPPLQTSIVLFLWASVLVLILCQHSHMKIQKFIHSLNLLINYLLLIQLLLCWLIINHRWLPRPLKWHVRKILNSFFFIYSPSQESNISPPINSVNWDISSSVISWYSISEIVSSG